MLLWASREWLTPSSVDQNSSFIPSWITRASHADVTLPKFELPKFTLTSWN